MEKDTQKVSRSTAVTDEDLIRNIQETGDNDSYLELRERYQKAYYSICHKYLKSCKSIGLKEEDILGNMDFTLFNAARTFDFSRKLKFSTWISNQARYFCLNSMRRGKKDMDNLNLFIEINHSEGEDEVNSFEREMYKNHEPPTLDIKNEVSYLLHKVQDEQVAEILHLRYHTPRKISWSDISKKLNIHYDICKSLHDNAIESFRNKMNISPRKSYV